MIRRMLGRAYTDAALYAAPRLFYGSRLHGRLRPVMWRWWTGTDRCPDCAVPLFPTSDGRPTAPVHEPWCPSMPRG